MIRALLVALLLIGIPAHVNAGCEPEPITPSTPTGIAGCLIFGEGIGSHYGPGDGVAMNFCTWELRHEQGCGVVTITSVQTGLSVTAPVIDFGDLYTGTPDERIIDMQFGVVEALGLDLSVGLYEVIVWPAAGPRPTLPSDSGASSWLPNTAAGLGWVRALGTVTAASDFLIGQSARIAGYTKN